ncbi:WD-40 repeat protein, partial [Reticulomyxa filosa]
NSKKKKKGMSKTEDEKVNETGKTELAPVSQQQLYIKDFICLICKQIANNPMEINCTQHKNTDELLIVGENCLKQFLSSNPNSCPVEQHDGCVYGKGRLAQRQISELIVVCPRQFEQEKDPQSPERSSCDFKGKIKQVNDHLENNCSLRLLDCWYKPFGCNYKCVKSVLQEHLVSEMQLHFDLVIQAFDALKQATEMRRVYLFIYLFIFVMQIVEHETQLEIKKDKDLALLKQQLTQCQQDILRFESSQKTTHIENEKLRKDIESKDNEIKNMKAEMQSNATKLTELQSAFQQAILKHHIDMELMKKDMMEKEKHMLEQQQIVTHLLEEKDDKKILESDNKSQQSFTLDFELLCSSQTLLGHTECVNSIDYLIFENEQLLCSGSNDETIGIWDIVSSQQIKVFKGHTDYVNCVKFSPYHHHNHCLSIVFSASNDATIRFWSVETGEQVGLLDAHTDSVTGVQFSPFVDGRYLCSGSWDKTVRLWDIETNTLLHAFDGHTFAVTCVEFSPLQSTTGTNTNRVGVIGGSGYTICSASNDHTVRLWDVETTRELSVFNGHTDAVKSVKYGQGIIGGANTILSGSFDKTVCLWDSRSKNAIHVFNGHTDGVTCVGYPSIEGNENVICSGSLDKTIRFWDIRNKKEFHKIKGSDDDGGIFCLQFTLLETGTDEKHKKIPTLFCGLGDGAIHLWNKQVS